MKYLDGNLIEFAKAGQFDVIITDCNCRNIMGSGFSASIKYHFPQAYLVNCQTPEGDRTKLGNYSSVKVDDILIINGYTQFDIGKTDPKILYPSIDQLFEKLSKDLDKGSRIGIPKIGCGISGGRWDVVSEIIMDHMGGFDITCVEYVLKTRYSTDQKVE